MATLTLEDRAGLQDLLAAYSWALDTGDADALVACFTADTRMVEEVFEEPDIWEGHAGIRALLRHYANAPGFPGRQHHTTQVQYQPRDDGSVGMRSFAFVTECHDEPPYTLRFAGWYQDIAVKEPDGHWRFAERVVRLWDGEILRRFPGKATFTPRKRPESLKRR
jgi:hypothetical protein